MKQFDIIGARKRCCYSRWLI